jgi:hypothetical protein
MAMIPGGAGAVGGGAVILGQAARGFGGALFQGLRGAAAAAPPVTIQMPTGGMNAASAAAMTAIAAQLSRNTASLIQQVSPYVKGSFWAFAIVLALVITEKVYNGPIGALLGAACRGLLVVLRLGAPVAKEGTIRFFKALSRVLKALFALPTQIRNEILERVVAIQNSAQRKIRTVREGIVVVNGYVRRARNSVVGSMHRSLARVKAASARARTVARSARAAVVGFRARRVAGRAAKNEAARMARNQKIRANLAAINQRVVATEERRIRELINKVKRTAVPLSSKNKREYLALARKAEKKAASANRNAAAVLAGMRGRASH